MKSIPALVVLASLSNLSYGQQGTSVVYAWSGFVERSGASNPWALSGDGATTTRTDGTPFTLELAVGNLSADTAAFGDAATYVPELVTLAIGGAPVSSVVNPTLDFRDDRFSGSFDELTFTSQVEFLGATLNFRASTRVLSGTFELSDSNAADPLPVFAEATIIQDGATLVTTGSTGGIQITTSPDTSVPVTARTIPEPTAVTLTALTLATLGLCSQRRC